jgi:predicted transcriptional regulator
MTAHPVTAYQALDRDGAFVPFDHKSLFTAMMTKLDTFEHDVLHAEDSPVDALRLLDQETELRRSIAFWLRKADHGVFDFTQEAVVVDENRTDIRFHPRTMPGYATVELKRETWSVRELEAALSDQLVGQYLQHENCRAGCLLICQAKAKKWRHPDTNAWMSLAEVVDHLEAIAKQVMASRPELHVAVKGIDYS